MPAPRIVAEALVPLAEAPLALRAGAFAPPAAVASALARAALPREAEVDCPRWLRPGQRVTARRALAALDDFGGALVADRTGSGKTYVALAVASVWKRDPPVCLVPSALTEQWQRTACELNVRVTIWTHERASRGALPRGPGMVIIDESHRFRNRSTRRYASVAPWLVGQRALLLSATPLVNRMADLCAQLALAVRDDALAGLGVTSLRALADVDVLPAPVGRVLLASPSAAGIPARIVRHERPGRACDRVLSGLDRLVLSRSPPIATLIRGVLHRAAASSPAALAGALTRYRLLLQHAADAREAGTILARAELRGWIGAIAEQTVLWPLVTPDAADPDLLIEDLPWLRRAEGTARTRALAHDPRSRRLASIVSDGKRTLIFTSSRETAIWLRDRLGTSGVAWCTGNRAGIGRTRLPRRAVLAAFGPGASSVARPSVLVATDVAAEGLDLQGAERVVHYDLPWTPMRLEQREGRVARLGSAATTVEVIRFDPPSRLDARLRQSEALHRKSTLPTRAGIAGEAMSAWRELLDALASRSGEGGVAALDWEGDDGTLAGLALLDADQGRRPAVVVLWVDGHGAASSDPATLTRALAAAATEPQGLVPDRCEVAAAVGRLEPHASALLRAAHGAVWIRREPVPEARRLARRLTIAGRDAARRRDARALDAIDRALGFTTRGHTAGETRLIEELADRPAGELCGRLAALGPGPSAVAIEVRLAGLIVFRSKRPPLR